jgi:putative component of toxin-antitoxin plasmid stabilization module
LALVIEFTLEKKGANLVVLLCGGDKSSQSKDIQLAKAYGKAYLSHGSL